MLRLFGPDCSPAPADAKSLKQIPPGAMWIDLLEPSEQEEKLAEAALGQNIPTREELLEIEPSSRLYERQGALFMTAAVVFGFDDGDPDTDPVGFILTDKLLVTVRYVDPTPFVVFAEHLYGEPELASNAPSIAVRLFDTIVDRLADQLEATAREIELVSKRIFDRGNGNSAESTRRDQRLEVLLIRLGKVQRMLTEIRESALSVGRLLSFLGASKLVAGGDHKPHVKSLHSDVGGLLDHADFLADNLTFLLDASLGLISLEQNYVMKLFSIFAVVLMPPTLVAGVYGMNFEHMPELNWLLGYPFALVMMLASAIIPYSLARRSGWL